MLPDFAAAATRLCSQCGMCCNGVMFHRVALQPADSATELTAFGLKLKCKRGQHFLLQPCPAFRETHCAIYAARPERCRLFECRQLQRLRTGGITEDMALKKIRGVKQLVRELNEILGQMDEGTGKKNPLLKRCHQALSDSALNGEGSELDVRLEGRMQELDAMLDEDFRIESEQNGKTRVTSNKIVRLKQ